MAKPKYPDIKVQLTGLENNAFEVLTKTKEALFQGLTDKGFHPKKIKAECDIFSAQATMKAYKHIIPTCRKWVVLV